MSAGIIYMLLASLIFSFVAIAVKDLKSIPVMEIIFFRALISVVLSFSHLKIKKIPIWGKQKNKKILWLRAVLGFLALALFFSTLQNMRLATAVTVRYLTPIFTVLVAAVFLKEKIIGKQYFFFFISFIGVLIIKGFDNEVSLFYLSLGVLSSLFSGGGYSCIHKLKTSESSLVVIFYTAFFSVIASGFITIFDWKMPQGSEWTMLILVGLLTQVAQIFMTKAFQLEDIAKVSSVTYVGLLYALGFGFFLFEETFEWFSYVGMFVVLLGMLLNLFYKSKFTKKAIPK